MARINNDGWSVLFLDIKNQRDKFGNPNDFREKKVPISEAIAERIMIFLDLLNKHQVLEANKFSLRGILGVDYEYNHIDGLYHTLKSLSIANPVGYPECRIVGSSTFETDFDYEVTEKDMIGVDLPFFWNGNGVVLDLNLSYILPVTEEYDDDDGKYYITWQGKQSKLLRRRFSNFFKEVEAKLGWYQEKYFIPPDDEPAWIEAGVTYDRVFAEGDWFYITREHLEDAMEVFEVKDDIREYLSPSQLVEYWEEQAAARIARMRAQGERRTLLQREVWQIEQWEALRTAVRSESVRALLAALPKTPVDPLLKAEIQGAGEEKLQLLAGVLR